MLHTRQNPCSLKCHININICSTQICTIHVFDLSLRKKHTSHICESHVNRYMTRCESHVSWCCQNVVTWNTHIARFMNVRTINLAVLFVKRVNVIKHSSLNNAAHCNLPEHGRAHLEPITTGSPAGLSCVNPHLLKVILVTFVLKGGG